MFKRRNLLVALCYKVNMSVTYYSERKRRLRETLEENKNPNGACETSTSWTCPRPEFQSSSLINFGRTHMKNIPPNNKEQPWNPPAYSQLVVAWYHQYLEILGVFLKGDQPLLIEPDKLKHNSPFYDLLEDYDPEDHGHCPYTEPRNLRCGHNHLLRNRECYNLVSWWHPRHSSMYCFAHSTFVHQKTIKRLWITDLYEITRGVLLQEYPQLQNLNHFNSYIHIKDYL